MTLHDPEHIQEKLRSVASPMGFLVNLFVHAPVGFAVWNADGSPLLTNNAFMEIFRTEPPPEYNVLSDSLLAANGMLPLFQKAFAGETVHVPTFWYDPREHTAFTVTEGRRVAISMTIFPLFKENGEIEYVAATYKDETEIALVNEQLRLREEELAATLHSIGDGVIATDASGLVTGMNPIAEDLTGWSLEDAKGMHLRDVFRIVHEGTRATVESPVDRVLREGAIVGLANHTVLVARDGTERAIADSGAPIRDQAGALRGVVLVFRDQTEERRAEQELRESEARKTAVMEAALDAIVLMNHEGIITDFNPAAERTFGYSRDEVVGKELADVIIPHALRDKHRGGLTKYLATGNETLLGKRIEVPAIRKNGGVFPAEVAVVRIRSQGAPYFTGYIRDITERRQAAEAEFLRREKEAAEAANRELEAFSYSVAHDLRSPLRGISGFSGALLDDYGDKLDENGKALIYRVTASAERMGHIIDALLSLARLSRTQVRRETVNLTLIARTIAEHLRATEPKRNVEFVVSDGIVARGDPSLLRAVLENLLENAWKFTNKRDHARIEFGCSAEPGALHYYVRDNGAGFDMAYAGRLFTPFQRLHSMDQFEGTGVGLATVQRIILRHGGRVWAESKENEGTVFQFTLPAEPSSTGGAPWIPAR